MPCVAAGHSEAPLVVRVRCRTCKGLPAPATVHASHVFTDFVVWPQASRSPAATSPPLAVWFAASEQGGADRIRHLGRSRLREESGRSTSGTPRPIPRSPSWVSAAADEPPVALLCFMLFPCLFRKPNCLLLIRPDRPSYRLLHVNQRQPERRWGGGRFPTAASGPVALSNLACRPTVTEMRVWRIAHGPGLHGPPGRLASKNPLSPGVLQIDEPGACVALAHLGPATPLPFPRRPMQMHAGGQTGRRLPFTASCSRHVLNLYISAKVLLSGTALVPRRRTSRATRCGA